MVWWSLACARPGSRFTTAFENTATWLVAHALSTVTILLRIAPGVGGRRPHRRDPARVLRRPRRATAGGLTHVSADGAEWILKVVRERAPKAVICPDAFHVVAWATAALDAVRRGAWKTLRASSNTTAARELNGTRWELLKTRRISPQRSGTTIAIIAQVNTLLYLAYLLKEQLREVFTVKGAQRRCGSPGPAAPGCPSSSSSPASCR